jgi:hypothetical protein
VNSAALERSPRSPFFYLDLSDTVRRVALLTAAVSNRIPTSDSLKREYVRALTQVNGVPLSIADHPQVVAGGPILRSARAKGLVDNSVSASSYSRKSRSVAIKQARHGLHFLRLEHPPLYELCDLLVTDIICWPSREFGGGSAPNVLGIAWLVPSHSLTSIEIAEFVVHEMIHMNVNLADMTVGLFTRGGATRFDAYSAVLGRRRPFNQAFHSACVAVAVLYFRLLVGLDRETDRLRSSLRRCTADLLKHRDAFTEYSWDAILAAHAFSRDPRLAEIPVHKGLMSPRAIRVEI